MGKDISYQPNTANVEYYASLLTKIKSRLNTLYPPLLSLNALNPFFENTSSPRLNMESNQLTQSLVLTKGNSRKIITGEERELGKYTFKTKAPCKMRILKVIRRYQPGNIYGEISSTPEVYVMYENLDHPQRQIDYLVMSKHFSNHQYFGYYFVNNQENCGMITEGQIIDEGIVFQDSPSVKNNGDYNFGISLNTIFMSDPSVADDGIVISRSAANRIGFNMFSIRTGEFGGKSIALNLYGDDDNYKPFPDIGDVIPDNGLLMAIRSYEGGLPIVEMSAKELRRVDYYHDKLIYAKKGGRIINIEIEHTRTNDPAEPHAYETQLLKYDQGTRQFHRELLDFYRAQKKVDRRGMGYSISEKFSTLIRESLAYLDDELLNERRGNRFNQDPSMLKNLIKVYKGNELDVWSVRFTIAEERNATIALKITNLHASKGVITDIREDEEMPTMPDGTRADVIMSNDSVINRMNFGAPIEVAYTSRQAKMLKEFRTYLGYGIHEDLEFADFNKVKSHVANYDYLKLYDRLTEYAWCTSDKHYEFMTSPEMQSNEKKLDHVTSVVMYKFVLYHPADNQLQKVESFIRLKMKGFESDRDYVSFMRNGKKITTRKKFEIGEVYFIILEKIGDDAMGVASGNRSLPFGVLAPRTNANRYSKPFTRQAIRFGEDEMNLVNSYCGSELAVEITDRNGSPEMSELMVYQMYKSKNVTNIPRLIDRDKYPYGNNRAVTITNHMLEASGIKFVYKPYDVTQRK